MISTLSLPTDGFLRSANGREEEDDDEEYSEYLQHYEDQQSLAKRLMGGNYNSRQQAKDSGVVNRGDYLFIAGGAYGTRSSLANQITLETIDAKLTALKQKKDETKVALEKYGIKMTRDNNVKYLHRIMRWEDFCRIMDILHNLCSDYMKLKRDIETFVKFRKEYLPGPMEGDFLVIGDQLKALVGFMLDMYDANADNPLELNQFPTSAPGSDEDISKVASDRYSYEKVKRIVPKESLPPPPSRKQQARRSPARNVEDEQPMNQQTVVNVEDEQPMNQQTVHPLDNNGVPLQTVQTVQQSVQQSMQQAPILPAALINVDEERPMNVDGEMPMNVDGEVPMRMEDDEERPINYDGENLTLEEYRRIMDGYGVPEEGAENMRFSTKRANTDFISAAAANAADGPVAATVAGVNAMVARQNANDANYNFKKSVAYQIFENLGEDGAHMYVPVSRAVGNEMEHELNVLKEKYKKELAVSKNQLDTEKAAIERLKVENKHIEDAIKIIDNHELAKKKEENAHEIKKAETEIKKKEKEIKEKKAKLERYVERVKLRHERKDRKQKIRDEREKRHYERKKRERENMIAARDFDWQIDDRVQKLKDDREKMYYERKKREREDMIAAQNFEWQINDRERKLDEEDRKWEWDQADRTQALADAATKRERERIKWEQEQTDRTLALLDAATKRDNDAEDRQRKLAEEDRKRRIEEEDRQRKLINENLDYLLKNARENRDKGFWAKRGDGDLFSTIDSNTTWDPLSNPLNKSFKRMENRIEQTVPPYDLPKNYPIYGGNYMGFPQQMNSLPYSMYGRNGRTGRRTNFEKYGVPSVRMYQRMKKIGMVGPNGMPMGYGTGSAPAPQEYDYYEPPPPREYTGYADGDFSYMQAMNRIAKGFLFGPGKQATTANQIVSSYLPNSNSSIPRMAYLASRGMNALVPQQMSNADKMEMIGNRVKLQEMIGKLDGDANADVRNQLTAMANKMNLPDEESKWSKLARYGTRTAAAGLTGMGVLAENFWPMHDAYHRYKTMKTVRNAIGSVGDAVARLFPSGSGYKKGRKKNKKRTKVRYGGMIIPPKNLKKMFAKDCKNCKF